MELSNLDKVLYPADGITKAEVIHYYLMLAPTVLRHLRGRPLSLVRYPDGISGERFFQKNRPDWTPDWIDYIRLGRERKKEYIVAKEDATLVWLANLACLEIHQVHSFTTYAEHPDYIVYDLDPPEGKNDFQEVKDLAFALKEELEGLGYHVFVKTTGGKGLHLLTPIEPIYSFDQSFNTAKAIAERLIRKHANTTLHLNKAARKGRVLIDIFRNRGSQTIVSAYSLRGRDGAPVSCPIEWEELPGLGSPASLNMATVMERASAGADPWETIRNYAVPLHSDKERRDAQRSLSSHPKRKEPAQLADYERKRDFSRTPEPYVPQDDGRGNRFVVQRHHASHLHYDLRLEEGGVLKSWVLPRGLPPYPGVKRLAVQTEDHPLEYLAFEAEIPKGLYGGGMMWVYAAGRYEITKQKKDGFYFRLSGPQVNGEYRMHNTKEKEWLLERVDRPQVDLLKQPVVPMVAMAKDRPPIGDYFYEVKWDGIRVIITLDEGRLTVRSRNQNDITAQFPELDVASDAFRINNAVFDGEVVCLDGEGRPNFRRVIKRLMGRSSTQGGIGQHKDRVHCYLFDVLYMDGRPLLKDPLARRKEWLVDSVRKGTPYRISEVVEDGEALFQAAQAMGLEGIMAKGRLGIYQPGKRSEAWYKVKVKNTTDALIVGYTIGNGERALTFGALHLMEPDADGHIYRGKVGTGFTEALLKEVAVVLKEHDGGTKPFADKVPDGSRWLEEFIPCEITYTELTKDGHYRDPVFVRLRPDL